MSMNDSSLRRSGNQTPEPIAVQAAVAPPGPARVVAPDVAPLRQAYCVGKPVFPPGGVIPPRPDQYGTFALR